MAEQIRISVEDVARHFEELEDPRSDINQRHPFVSVVVISLMAAFLQIRPDGWAVLVLTIRAVTAAEIGNTVVEAVVDLVSPEYHELAKVAKDAAAATVLSLAMTAVVVGVLILGPPRYERFFN